MKTLFVLLCLLLTTAAFGQAIGYASVVSNQPVVIQIPSHPLHAAREPMAQEQSLIAGPAYISAQGERPLWEVARIPDTMPLGDVARLLRKQHATAKKATIVLEK
ncbi:MAG: hypothetical protein WCC22_14495 [Terriglobales bacterium]